MASFTISTLAGTVLAELPLDDALCDLVVSDLLERLPPLDGTGGVPRLLLGPRELGWSERLADLTLAPGGVVTLLLVRDPVKAAADLMGTDGTGVRLAAARALRAMGAAASGQAEELADAVLSDPDAGVVYEALQALRDMGAPEESESAAFWASHFGAIAQLAHDLEDPRELYVEVDSPAIYNLTSQLEAVLMRCGASRGHAALRSRTVLRRLAPLDPEAAGRHEALLAEPLADPRPEVRLATVAVLGLRLMDNHKEDADAVSKLCGMLLGDACLDVQRRAAATLGRARRLRVAWGLPAHHLAGGLESAGAALATEVEALRRSALPADRCRMKAVAALPELLN